MVNADPPASCARTDARKIDRDVQMRYDIAKNEEGPLRRTVGKALAGGDVKGKGKTKEGLDAAGTAERDVTAERYPALDERLANAETHLAVRYGASFHFSALMSVAELQHSTLAPTLFA